MGNAKNYSTSPIRFVLGIYPRGLGYISALEAAYPGARGFAVIEAWLSPEEYLRHIAEACFVALPAYHAGDIGSTTTALTEALSLGRVVVTSVTDPVTSVTDDPGACREGQMMKRIVLPG